MISLNYANCETNEIEDHYSIHSNWDAGSVCVFVQASNSYCKNLLGIRDLPDEHPVLWSCGYVNNELKNGIRIPQDYMSYLRKRRAPEPMYACQCPDVSEHSYPGCGDETYGYMCYDAGELMWWPDEFESITGIPAGWYRWADCFTEQLWYEEHEKWEDLAEFLGLPRWKALFWECTEEEWNRYPNQITRENNYGDPDPCEFIYWVLGGLHSLGAWLRGEAIFYAKKPIVYCSCEGQETYSYPPDEIIWWNGGYGHKAGWYSQAWLEGDTWYWYFEENGFSKEEIEAFEKNILRVAWEGLTLDCFWKDEKNRPRHFAI